MYFNTAKKIINLKKQGENNNTRMKCKSIAHYNTNLQYYKIFIFTLNKVFCHIFFYSNKHNHKLLFLNNQTNKNCKLCYQEKLHFKHWKKIEIINV